MRPPPLKDLREIVKALLKKGRKALLLISRGENATQKSLFKEMRFCGKAGLARRDGACNRGCDFLELKKYDFKGLNMRIAFVNQKGGVGKTTLAINVAGFMAKKGMKILLIDADPQQSALDWAGVREGGSPFTIIGMARPVIHKELPKLEEGFTHVIIDSPPSVHQLTQSIVGASDVVVVPVQPSPYDVWAAEAVLKVIDDASAVLNPELKTVFAINRKIVNTAIGRDVSQSLTEYGKPVLSSHVCQRVGFAESAAQGKTVFEIDHKSPAALEIAALTKEILAL